MLRNNIIKIAFHQLEPEHHKPAAVASRTIYKMTVDTSMPAYGTVHVISKYNHH
jgi:hypothetical protein